MSVRTWARAGTLVAAGFAAGIAINALSPHPAALGSAVLSAAEAGGGTCGDPTAASAPVPIERISVEAAKAHCADCTAGFVDARGAHAFADGHIANAIHLPPAGHPDEGSAIAQLSSFARVIVYDGDYSCALADDVAQRLRKGGIQDVRVLEGAWPAWIAAEGPAAAGSCGVCGHGEATP